MGKSVKVIRRRETMDDLLRPETQRSDCSPERVSFCGADASRSGTAQSKDLYKR